jgi:hypothetical protein
MLAEDFEAAREQWERNRIAYLRRVAPRARVRWRRRGEPSPWEGATDQNGTSLSGEPHPQF